MLRLGETKLALDEAVAGDGDEKDSNAPEREIKVSLLKSLRQQYEAKDVEMKWSITMNMAVHRL